MALQDNVWTAGLELSAKAAGVQAVTNLTIDYIGQVHPNGTCDETGTEHGVDQCVVDRYHLCAQHPDGMLTSHQKDWQWWGYVHCMFLNQGYLKCGNNGHCADRASFTKQLHSVHSFCAAQTGVDGDAISTCAASPAAAKMAQASYAAAKAMDAGFAVRSAKEWG